MDKCRFPEKEFLDFLKKCDVDGDIEQKKVSFEILRKNDKNII